MRSLFGVNKSKAKSTILFVFIQNAGRSQMAEGFFRKYASKDYDAISAGTRPISEVNPVSVEVIGTFIVVVFATVFYAITT